MKPPATPLICPITYTPINPGEKYSKKGLKALSSKLSTLKDLPLSSEEQRREAQERSDKMSIQGVQLKLSATLNIQKQCFEICDSGGNYILKPPSEFYPELPQNEDLSMRLAQGIIDVPLHGLIYNSDGEFTYFIKRFDRIARKQKLNLEDFSQLAGLTRDTKYNFSLERIIPIIEKYCTFPAIEKLKFFKIILFNYLIGNEDMHLKNFSLLSQDNIIALSPAYDYINTTLAMNHRTKEEIALPLNGKKNHLTLKDFIEYFGQERLLLNQTLINDTRLLFSKHLPEWKKLIQISFLSEKSKKDYVSLLETRASIMRLE